MDIAQHLKGYTTTKTVDPIQHNIASVGGVFNRLGHEAKFVHIETGFTNMPMGTSLIGTNIPDPVFMTRTPIPTGVLGTTTIRQTSSSPNKGGCS